MKATRLARSARGTVTAPISPSPSDVGFRLTPASIGQLLALGSPGRYTAEEPFLQSVVDTVHRTTEATDAFIVLPTANEFRLSFSAASGHVWRRLVEAATRRLPGRTRAFLSALRQELIAHDPGLSVVWLSAPDGSMGLLGIARSSPLSDETEQILSVALSGAIVNFRVHLHRETELQIAREHLEELGFMAHISTILTVQQGLPEIMETILEQCAGAIHGERACLFTFEPIEGDLRAVASWGTGTNVSSEPIPLRSGEHDDASLLIKIRYTDHAASEFPRLSQNAVMRSLSDGLSTWILMPLCTEKGLLGVIMVGRMAPETVPESERRHLLTLARVAEKAIGRAIANEAWQARARDEAAALARSEYLSIMSHELRTPLTAILGFSEVLLERHFGPLLDKQQEYLEDIVQNGNHLLELINNVLDLARIESGKVQLSLEAIDLRTLLKESRMAFLPTVRRQGLTLHMPQQQRFPALMADRRRLKQVLYNLIGNAIKFTEPGGTVRVVVEPKDGCLLFTVEDTGIGISKDEQEKIFQPFSQASRPPGRVYEGTGLGLSLTRRLVEMHGGCVWVESEPGRGSRFYFFLPLPRECS